MTATYETPPISRSQALEDGDLIDVSSAASRAGHPWPVAITRKVWSGLLAYAEVSGQDEQELLVETLAVLAKTVAGCGVRAVVDFRNSFDAFGAIYGQEDGKPVVTIVARAVSTKCFMVNPFDVVVLGVDTDDPPASYDLVMNAHKNRIPAPPDDDLLASIDHCGVEFPIVSRKMWLSAGMTLHGRLLEKDEKHLVVIEGRRRTLSVRELCRRAGDPDGTKKSYVLRSWPPKNGVTIKELALLARQLPNTGITRKA